MAGVIKPDKFTATRLFSFEDLEGKARSIIAEARRQAVEIIAQAEQEGRRRADALAEAAVPAAREQGRREAYEEAREKALADALKEARQDHAALKQSLVALITEFEENKRRILAQAERGLLELSLAVARRVCKHPVGASSDAARANLATLLELVKHEADVELHVNPADVETIKQAVPDLLSAADRMEHVEIKPDPNVSRGGCLLRSREGAIDATLETQLDRAAAALLGVNDYRASINEM